MLTLLKKHPSLVIALIAALLFIPGLGAVHLFDWDEINFAEIAREMVVSGDWSRPTIGFEPFHEKPPLFMWVQAMSMSALGVNEFAARLPNAICGIITLLVLYRLGSRWRGQVFGLLWVLAYAGSILPHLYFRSGIIDPWFNLFIFLGIAAFMRCAEEVSARHALFSGLWLGLAVMTKGPAAVIIMGLTVLVLWAGQRFKPFFQWSHVLLIVVAMLAVIALWAASDYLRNGPEFMLAFFQRQVDLFTQEDAGHGGFFGYHFVVLLFGCFPASWFALQEMLSPSSRASARLRDGRSDPGGRSAEVSAGSLRAAPPSRTLAMTERRWMLALFWVVLILFSIVKTKIVHYSSLCYFPLTFLAALQLERIVARNEGFGWTRFAVGIFGNIVAAVVLALPFVMMNKQLIAPLFSADPFAQANLEAEVDWHWSAALAGAWLIAVLTTAHVLHQRREHARSAVVLFAGSGVFVTITLFFFIRNIEGHSQRAAIGFFEEHAGERCWLLTKNYKSYAPEFYGRVSEARPDEATLLTGAIDRPVYLACKVTATEEVAALGTFQELFRKNGVVFWERRP